MWSEVTDLARLIREGETKWEDLDLDDIDVRLKWAGLFHRRKRHPGTFMMRVKVCGWVTSLSSVLWICWCVIVIVGFWHVECAAQF